MFVGASFTVGQLLADRDKCPVLVFLAEAVLCAAVAHVEQPCYMAVVLYEEADPLADKRQRAAFELNTSWHWLKLAAECYGTHLYWLVYYCFCHHTSPKFFRVKKD